MTRPSAVVEEGTAAASGAASAGAASRPATTTSRMPPPRCVVSTFWVAAPCRTPATFVAVSTTTVSAAYSGEASARAARRATERHEPGGVVTEDEGQQRDGAGLHDAQPRPREEEAHAPAEGPRQVLIVAAGAGYAEAISA